MGGEAGSLSVRAEGVADGACKKQKLGKCMVRTARGRTVDVCLRSAHMLPRKVPS